MLARTNTLFHQNTIARPAAIAGQGIHTGTPAQIRLLPAPADSGIRFLRTDLGGLELPALASRVSSLELATTLGCEDFSVSTVEHLLAAVRILGVDNLNIEIDGPEVPILDGSALPFAHLLEAAGIQQQSAARRILAVTAPIEVEVDDKLIRISPYPGLRVTYSIDFTSSTIGRQEVDITVDRESFERELAPARTFALWADIERLRDNGLGLGGNSENCIVFGDSGPMNTTLRFANEPVRHKALDALGDLALLGAPIWGHIEVERGGHLLHFRLMEALEQQPENWTWMTAVSGSVETTRHASEAEFPAPPAALIHPDFDRRREQGEGRHRARRAVG